MATPLTSGRGSGDDQDGGKDAEGLWAARRRGGEHKERPEAHRGLFKAILPSSGKTVGWVGNQASGAETASAASASGERTPVGRGSARGEVEAGVEVLVGPGGKQAAEDVREHDGSVEAAEREVRRPGGKVRVAEDGEIVPVD